MENETELVERAQAGDLDAFDSLVHRYERPIYFLALRYVGDHDSATDLSQKAFIRALKGLGGFRRKSSFRTWLYRITINLCKNHLRDNPASRRQPLSDAMPSHTPSPADALEKAEQSHRLRAAVRELPERQRQVVLLRIDQELSFKEIASVLGCNVGSAKVNFHYALKRLREIFREEERLETMRQDREAAV